MFDYNHLFSTLGSVTRLAMYTFEEIVIFRAIIITIVKNIEMMLVFT